MWTIDSYASIDNLQTQEVVTNMGTIQSPKYC